MDDAWKACRDRALVVRLHCATNPGLYELLGQYSRLRPADLDRRPVQTWVHRSGSSTDGYAIGLTSPGEFCLLALQCRCSGLADRTVRPWQPHDERLLSVTRAWIRRLSVRAARPVIVRVESDNPFGTLLAKRFGWPLETVLLLATRTTQGFPPFPAPAGYRLRRYQVGDERAFVRIHREAFHHEVSAVVYRRWAEQPSCETFSAIRDSEVVGLMIAELRRGGELGDFNLAVSAEHRNRGLGPALLAAGVRSLRRRGARTVVADHWSTNAPAVALYRKYGFRIEQAYSYFRAW